MIAVGAYPTRSDAELAQSALAAAGIQSLFAADDAGGAYPFDLTGAARSSSRKPMQTTPRRILSDQPQRTEGSNHDDVVHSRSGDADQP